MPHPDLDNMYKLQLDTLHYSKQLKSTLDGIEKVYDLSKAKIAALLRAQQASASSSRPRKVARR